MTRTLPATPPVLVPLAPCHLLGDVAVFINIVEVKSPLQLLVHRPPQQDGEADDKILPEKARPSAGTSHGHRRHTQTPGDGPVSRPARPFAPRLQRCRGAAIDRGTPRGIFFFFLLIPFLFSLVAIFNHNGKTGAGPPANHPCRSAWNSPGTGSRRRGVRKFWLRRAFIPDRARARGKI